MPHLLASGAHTICLHGSHVLLIRRSLELDTWPGFWSFPGGKVEEGEFFRECALRETEEEVGITIEGSNIEQDIFVETRTVQGMKMYYFAVVSDWDNMPENIEPEKHADIEWFHIDDLPTPFVPHHMAALDCYKTGKSYTELDVAP
jgi:8-oxo-dGTP diphosphatase